MVIADIIGLKVNTVDRNSRRILKLRLDGAVELHLGGPTWKDENGQDINAQRMVGGVITAAAFSGADPNRVLTITYTDRFGKAGCQLVTSSAVTDTRHIVIAT